MKKRRYIVLALLVVLSGTAAAYYWTRAKPLYCQVVFGPDARLRVWFVLHGKNLYFDRAGGDTPRMAERIGESAVQLPIKLADPDGRTRYAITEVHDLYVPWAVGPERPQELYVSVNVSGPLAYSQYGTVTMAEQPRSAGIAHFHGPLAMRVRAEEPKTASSLTLVLGAKPTDVSVEVSTFWPESGSWVAVYSSDPRDRNVPAFPQG